MKTEVAIQGLQQQCGLPITSTIDRRTFVALYYDQDAVGAVRMLGDTLLTLAYDAVTKSLSLTYTTHVQIQSQTMDNGMRSEAGETDIEIVLGFVPDSP